MADEKPVSEWIAEAKAGSREARSEIVTYYWPYVVKGCIYGITASGITKSRPSDIAQDVFEKVMGKFDTGQFEDTHDRNAFKKMLPMIITGKVIDARRRELAEKRGGKKRHVGVSNLTPVHDKSWLPEVAAELRERLDQLISRLPPCDQAIIKLKLSGLDDEDLLKQLFREHGIITPEMVKRTFKGFEKLLKSEIARLRKTAK